MLTFQRQSQELVKLSENDCKSTTTRTTQAISPDDSCQGSLVKSHDGVKKDGGLDTDSETTAETEAGTTSFQFSALDVDLDRCRNPDPVASEQPHTHRHNEATTAAVQISSKPVPLIVIPNVVRVTPIHPKALRPNAIMTEAEGNRRKQAQMDFPRTSKKNTLTPTASAMQNNQNGSLRSQSSDQRKHAHQQQLTTIRASPSISQSSVSSKGKITHSMGGGGSMTSSVGSPNLHPTPLFQRLVSEEVQELKAYNRIIESQNRRLAELERVHGDLEVRLEVQSNRRLELEKTLEDRERTWAEEIHEIEQERDQQKDLVTAERSKNGRLMDQVVRKDQDIQRMLQRKYDHQRNDGLGSSIRNARGPSKSPVATNGHHGDSPTLRHDHKSPHDLLNASGSSEAVRERIVSNALMDFFGLATKINSKAKPAD